MAGSFSATSVLVVLVLASALAQTVAGVMYPHTPNWIRQKGGQGRDRYQDIAAAPDGTAYAVGHTTSDAFGPGFVGTTSDAMVVRYDQEGTLLAAQRIGKTERDVLYGVGVWGDQVIAVGHTENSWVPQFDNAGVGDGWIIVLDAVTLQITDALTIGTAGFDELFAALVVGDALYCGGYTRGNLVQAADNTDMMLLRFDLGGPDLLTGEVWRSQVDHPASDSVDYIRFLTPGLANNNDLYAVGLYNGDTNVLRFSRADGSLLFSQSYDEPSARSTLLGPPIVDTDRSLLYAMRMVSTAEWLNGTIAALPLSPTGEVSATPEWEYLAYTDYNPAVFSTLSNQNGFLSGSALINKDLFIFAGYAHGLKDFHAENVLGFVDVAKRAPAHVVDGDATRWLGWGASATVLDATYGLAVAPDNSLWLAGETGGSFPGEPNNLGAWPSGSEAEQTSELDAFVATCRVITNDDWFYWLIVIAASLTAAVLFGAVFMTLRSNSNSRKEREARRAAETGDGSSKRPMSFAPSELVSVFSVESDMSTQAHNRAYDEAHGITSGGTLLSNDSAALSSGSLDRTLSDDGADRRMSRDRRRSSQGRRSSESRRSGSRRTRRSRDGSRRSRGSKDGSRRSRSRGSSAEGSRRARGRSSEDGARHGSRGRRHGNRGVGTDSPRKRHSTMSMVTNDDGRGEGPSRLKPKIINTIPVANLIETSSNLVSVNSEMAPHLNNTDEDVYQLNP